MDGTPIKSKTRADEKDEEHDDDDDDVDEVDPYAKPPAKPQAPATIEHEDGLTLYSIETSVDNLISTNPNNSRTIEKLILNELSNSGDLYSHYHFHLRFHPNLSAVSFYAYPAISYEEYHQTTLLLKVVQSSAVNTLTYMVTTAISAAAAMAVCVQS